MKLFPFSRYIVSGHSMLPTLKPGQGVVCFNWFTDIKEGDIVIFQKKAKLIIKRVKKIDDGRLRVEGDNHQDSLEFGWVKRSDVLGKVIWY